MLETSILIGLVVPGDTVVIVAGTAVASPLEGVLLGVAVVLGALVGESIGYWLGRVLGPRIRASRIGQRSATTTGRVRALPAPARGSRDLPLAVPARSFIRSCR